MVVTEDGTLTFGPPQWGFHLNGLWGLNLLDRLNRLEDACQLLASDDDREEIPAPVSEA